MNNVFETALPIHDRFDLKVSINFVHFGKAAFSFFAAVRFEEKCDRVFPQDKLYVLSVRGFAKLKLTISARVSFECHFKDRSEIDKFTFWLYCVWRDRLEIAKFMKTSWRKWEEIPCSRTSILMRRWKQSTSVNVRYITRYKYSSILDEKKLRFWSFACRCGNNEGLPLFGKGQEREV